MSMLGTRLIITVGGSTTHHVYPDDSIQDAINSAQSGDTIIVHNGTYYENVGIDKSILLIGENKYNTVIDGSGAGDVIWITANNVNITGFTIRGGASTYGGGIYVHSSGNDISYNIVTNNINDGIYLVSSSNNILMGNIVSSNDDDGIELWEYCNNNTLIGNTVTNSGVGIHIYRSSDNKLIGNDVTGIYNEDTGIYISEHSNNNILILNDVTNNEWQGILIHAYGDNNTLIGNTVSNNGRGIRLAFSNNNTIFHNNFINNTQQVSNLESVNTWDDGYPSGGNYWSDYTDVDLYSGPYQNETGSDGIGDTPHILDADNQDRYPLMSPWGDVEPPVADAGSNQSVFQGMTVTFDASGSTDDVAIRGYVWTFTDVTLKTLTGMQPSYTFNNVGDFEVTLNVSDYAGKRDTDTMWIHVLQDTTKPSIGDVSQVPTIPDDGGKVTVTVDVTDGESGVHNVTISYRTNSEPWTNVSMSKLTGDTWEGEILGQSAETNVQYKIIAYDKAGNFKVDDQGGEYYVYTVIPEFPTWTSVLLTLIVLTVAIAIYKRRLPKTPFH